MTIEENEENIKLERCGERWSKFLVSLLLYGERRKKILKDFQRKVISMLKHELFHARFNLVWILITS